MKIYPIEYKFGQMLIEPFQNGRRSFLTLCQSGEMLPSVVLEATSNLKTYLILINVLPCI